VYDWQKAYRKMSTMGGSGNRRFSHIRPVGDMEGIRRASMASDSRRESKAFRRPSTASDGEGDDGKSWSMHRRDPRILSDAREARRRSMGYGNQVRNGTARHACRPGLGA
jgi:hypothetical protein